MAVQPMLKATGAGVHWSERLRPRQTDTMAGEAAEDCKRFARRKRMDSPAFIHHERLPASLRCVVRDSSSTGALLQFKADVASVDDLPDSFTLVLLHAKEQTEVKCSVMRRMADMVGVRFISPFRTTPVQGRGAASRTATPKTAKPARSKLKA